ncbi:helix-turn-helix transcriptional regulator [Gordonia westfalica]|uniref:Helix-turn-helix transcriptional regulator n=1 Tax=Gordonia westfalica TaxID=158898 RepID=A0ABU2GSN8_9ACTN|nr:helix-turn-helix transcriptional regulator [Gordonia westfalica]MDS1114474.1 helix-turn-helix transcriptional regulator [Gordonia westfalica]
MQHRFAESLTRERAERNLSLRALSEALEEATGIKIDPSGLKRIESGEREPRLNEALAISQTLGVDLPLLALTDSMRVRTAASWVADSLSTLNEQVDELVGRLEYVDAVIDSITGEERRDAARSYFRVDKLRKIVDSLQKLTEPMGSVISAYRHPSSAVLERTLDAPET